MGSMNIIRRALLGAAAVLIFLAGAPAWGGSTTEPRVMPDPSGNFKMIDYFGRERLIKRPIRRAIVLGGAAMETVWALGAGDLVVARSQWTNWPPAMAQRPCIGSSSRPNLELIWKLQPDIILADGYFFGPLQLIESLGVPVVSVNGYFQAKVKGMVRALGQLFERTDRAEELLDAIDRLSDLLADRVGGLNDLDRPKVFMGYGQQFYITSNAKRGRRLISLGGGINIADALPFPWQRVSAEWLVAQAPDYLVIQADAGRIGYRVPDRDFMVAHQREVMSRPGLRSLSCTAKGRVLLIDNRITYGLRNLIGALHLAKAFHPDLMADIDPLETHRKLMDRFFGMEMDGCYFFP